jgi:polyhydroxyalkanoate synthesis regulator phasin
LETVLRIGQTVASKAAEFKDRHQDVGKLTPEETRKIVSAICDADGDARKDVGRDASDRVSRELSDKESELERIKNDATKLLDDVISDDNLKDNQDDAKSLKDDVQRRWESIERMTQSLRGANHPVVAFMLQNGCDAKEVTLDDGRVDCLMASGETCLVIELNRTSPQMQRRRGCKPGWWRETRHHGDPDTPACVRFQGSELPGAGTQGRAPVAWVVVVDDKRAAQDTLRVSLVREPSGRGTSDPGKRSVGQGRRVSIRLGIRYRRD